MIFHHAAEQDVLLELHSDHATGLTENQVLEARRQHGENKLREKKKKTNFQRFLDQFKDVMILILIAAAVISFAIACVEGEPKEFFEPALILLIVILNAIMGVMQESKAEKALDALKNLSAPHARVIRGGEEKVIDAAELVPGDIIRLEAGDFIPADGRLLRSVSLKSEESALTGESVPSEKDANTMYLGATKTPFWKNLVAGALGVLPGMILATFMGESIQDPKSPIFWLSGGLMIILAALSVLLYYLYRRRIQKKGVRTE